MIQDWEMVDSERGEDSKVDSESVLGFMRFEFRIKIADSLLIVDVVFDKRI